MNKQPSSVTSSKVRGRIILLVVAVLALYVVLPRLGGDFSQSWETLIAANPGLVLLALAGVVATYGWAGCMYWVLAIRQVAFWPTLAVQGASAFTNRLLPAGLGGLALNIEYLRKSRHTLPQALAVVGANNSLGFAGHFLLFLLVGIVSGGKIFQGLSVSDTSVNAFWVMAAAVVVVAANVLAFKRLRRYLYKLTADVTRHFVAYRANPGRLLAALLCSMALTASYAAVLYICGAAVGLDGISFWNKFAIFTVGVAAASVTPTPGGLGGAEAGLLAALVSYGADFSDGLAAVLLYRMLTYWLPLLPGLGLFLAVRKRLL